jgi:hypothetical protein
MTTTTPGLAALLLVAFAGSAPAQQAPPATAAPALADCAGDYVCVRDPSVVATWPLDRWARFRKIAPQPDAAAAPPATPPAQLARRNQP